MSAQRDVRVDPLGWTYDVMVATETVLIDPNVSATIKLDYCLANVRRVEDALRPLVIAREANQ